MIQRPTTATYIASRARTALKRVSMSFGHPRAGGDAWLVGGVTAAGDHDRRHRAADRDYEATRGPRLRGTTRFPMSLRRLDLREHVLELRIGDELVVHGL